MKPHIDRRYLTEPTDVGRLYKRLLGQLLADRVGPIKNFAVPIQCFLEMGMPARLGHLSGREFHVWDGDQVSIAIQNFPLEMRFPGDWDDAHLRAACGNLEQFTQHVWATFLEMNDRYPGSWFAN